MTLNCFVRNNVFIDTGSQLLTFPRTFDMTFEKNILIAEEITFRAPTGAPVSQEVIDELPDSIKKFAKANGITSMPNNIMLSRSGKINFIEYSENSAKEPKPLEPLDGTVFADPKLVDWENGNFNFEPDSPALELGIEPIDVSTAGRLR